MEASVPLTLSVHIWAGRFICSLSWHRNMHKCDTFLCKAETLSYVTYHYSAQCILHFMTKTLLFRYSIRKGVEKCDMWNAPIFSLQLNHCWHFHLSTKLLSSQIVFRQNQSHCKPINNLAKCHAMPLLQCKHWAKHSCRFNENEVHTKWTMDLIIKLSSDRCQCVGATVERNSISLWWTPWNSRAQISFQFQSNPKEFDPLISLFDW